MRYQTEAPDPSTYQAGEALDFHRESLDLVLSREVTVLTEREEIVRHLRGLIENVADLGGPCLRGRLADLADELSVRLRRGGDS